MKICGVFLAVASVGVLTGCNRGDLVWSGNYSFPQTSWQPEFSPVFVPDTMSLQLRSPRHAVVSIRYAEDLNVEMLPVVVELSSTKTGNFDTDTVRPSILPFAMRTADKGRLGIFETCDTLDLKYKISPGNIFTLYPADTEKDISGIYSLTFELY